MEVTFTFQKQSTLRSRYILRSFLERLVKSEGRKLGFLSIVFCSDEFLLDMNKNYLQHDYYTDIITFDLGEPGSKELNGELYISIDRVKDNAQTQGASFTDELRRVIFHGVLHLCGYKDKSPADQKAMRASEDKYLKKYKRFHVEHNG